MRYSIFAIYDTKNSAECQLSKAKFKACASLCLKDDIFVKTSQIKNCHGKVEEKLFPNSIFRFHGKI